MPENIWAILGLVENLVKKLEIKDIIIMDGLIKPRDATTAPRSFFSL